MINGNTNELKAPVRQITAKAELLHNSSAQAAKTGFKDVRISDSVKYTAPIEVKVASKNLFDDVAFYNANGFVLQEDGTWYGTHKNKVIFTNTDGRPGTFTISAYGKRMAPSIVYMIKYTDGTTAYSTTIPYNEFGSFSYTTDKNKIVNTISWIHQNAGDYYIKEVQIEYGAEATAYTPYQDPTQAEIVRYGKNMFELNTITFNESPTIMLEYPLPPGNYYFHIVNAVSTVSKETRSCVAFYNDSEMLKTAIFYQDEDYTLSFTLNKPCNKVILYAGSSWLSSQGQTATFYNMMVCNADLFTYKEGTQFEPFRTPQKATPNESGLITEFTNLYPNNLLVETGRKNVTISATYYIPEGEDATLTSDSDLMSVTVERLGESKFFGYGVSQKANIKIRDIDRGYIPSTKNFIKLYLNEVCTLPIFYVTEVHRDENTNQLSITCYDKLNEASGHTVSELELNSYTIGEFAVACGRLLGLEVSYPALNAFEMYYGEGANFEGVETIREALNDVAEATQTIYYINDQNTLVFKRLDNDGEPVLTIGKDDYITLDSKTNRRLVGVCNATELGDNVEAKLEQSGTTQFIRDNAFLELREDIGDIVDAALAEVGGLTINQFDCKWRGNYFLEIGDKIGLTTKDNGLVTSYFLNDTLTYDGSLTQATKWEYTDGEETATNPSSLGDILKQTYARVDKQQKTISMVASEVETNKNNISTLEINTKSISGIVEGIKAQTDSNTGEISQLTERVAAQITQEDVTLEIQKELANGVSKVETTTGFKFDETGLTVSKTNSEMETKVTEDGLQVYKGGREALTANNEGVKAVDLHATTYLVIGKNSRFEDFKSNRTACFWIGG